jgi:hypothetical protein
MEHSTCYNESNHWNALTDGRIKYVFRAFFADEQLFNLTADPKETTELSQDPAYAKVLQQRVAGQTYSPNYPKGPPAVPNSRITLGNNGAPNDQWLISKNTDPSSMRLMNSTLCLAVDDAPAPGAGLIAAECRTPTTSAQLFAAISSPSVHGYIQIKHIASRLCVTANNTAVSLSPCQSPPADVQVWVDGASGRVCADKANSQCLTAGSSWAEWETHYGAPPQDDLRKY